MNNIVIYYLEIFGRIFTVSLFRVFLGAAIFFAPFVACALGFWFSDSNLFIFNGAWASKVASAAILIYGFNVSVGVFFALGEGLSEYVTFELRKPY